MNILSNLRAISINVIPHLKLTFFNREINLCKAVKLSFATFAFMATLCSFPIQAFSSDEDLFAVFGPNLYLAMLRKDSMISVTLRDQVSDGCWINTKAAKTAVEKNLIISGFQNIADTEDTAFIEIELSGLGYETGGVCAIYVGLDVIMIEADTKNSNGTELTTLTSKSQFRRGTLLTGPKNRMSQRIKEALYEMSDEFIVAINSERNFLKSKVQESSEPAYRKDAVLRALALY